MAQIHIQRPHQLGLAGARKVAWQWAEQAEVDFDMACTYEEGEDATFEMVVAGRLLDDGDGVLTHAGTCGRTVALP